MRSTPGVMLLAFVVATACSGPMQEPPGGELVLWESGAVRPRFPVPPEAVWEAERQHALEALSARETVGHLFACYSHPDVEATTAFYALEYSLALVDIPWTEVEGVGGTWREASIPQAGDLPAAVLTTPIPASGDETQRPGVLISMHWTPPGPAED